MGKIEVEKITRGLQGGPPETAITDHAQEDLLAATLPDLNLELNVEFKKLYNTKDPKVVHELARKVFDLIDVDRDGSLSKEEIKQTFIRLSQNAKNPVSLERAENAAKYAVLKMDTDLNGEV